MELKKFNLLFIKFNLVLALIILTLSLTLAVSDTSGGNLVGKQGETIMLPQECASCTYVTVTSIQYPNLTRVYLNAPMTQQGSSYDYEFSDTNLLGEYTYCGVGDVDATDTTFCNDFEITLSGVQQKMTLLIANISLMIIILLVIFILHKKYKNTSYKETNNKIGESHNGNWGKTFIKTLGNNFMRNSFLWYYSLGWLFLIVLKDVVFNFGTEEVYDFFLISLDIYSLGFFLIIVVWIGILIHHFRFITDLINDLNLGVRE
jgi:hypothetical protein